MPRQPAVVPALSLTGETPCGIPSRPKFTFDTDLMKRAEQGHILRCGACGAAFTHFSNVVQFTYTYPFCHRLNLHLPRRGEKCHFPFSGIVALLQEVRRDDENTGPIFIFPNKCSHICPNKIITQSK